jgi:acetyltransferase
MNKLDHFFSPKSIAIVGASPKHGKLGNVLIENIRKGGWKGKIYFVNPKYAKKKPGYFSSLSEIRKSVDLVLIAIPAPFVNKAIRDGAESRPAIKNFAVISAGFKESGPAGQKLEEELESLAKKYDLNILGPNCLGFANPAKKLNATFTDMALHPGRIAIVSQSGALAVAILDWAEERKIGFSKIISIGNKTVIDESQIIEFLSKDKETDVIALYLEDIKSGSKFLQAVSKTSPRKPVVILKAGKTSAGQKAVSSHTGSLAQDEEIVEAVFEKLNVIAANSIEEFQNVVYYLAFNQFPKKRDVVVLTNAGGPGVMASDFVGKSKTINLLSFSKDFKDELKKYLPTSASVENPIDVIGDAPPERYQKTLEALSKKHSDYPILLLLTPQNQTDPDKVVRIIEKMKHALPNLSVSFMGGKKIARAVATLENNRLPNFESPELALRAIEMLAAYQGRKKDNLKKNEVENIRQNSIVIKNAILQKRRLLFWNETEKLFKDCGVKLAKSISFSDFNELSGKKISFPCVIKTDDPTIAHRLGNNAIALNIKDEKILGNSFLNMKKSTKAIRFLVQPMVRPGIEIILGMKRDPTFGPVILCGWGGSLTEVFKDKFIVTGVFDKKEFEKKLSGLKIFPILKGFRGEAGYELKTISSVAEAISKITENNPTIKEIDVNPLVVYNDGGEGKILDAKIFLT